jgi:hypothetical protein
MLTKRFILGILSSALFAVGLTRAADRIDPVSQSVRDTNVVVTTSSPDSSTDTWIVSKSAPDSSTDTWIDSKGN